MSTDGDYSPGDLLQQNALLTLGDITLGQADDFGVGWGLTNVTGWSDPVPTTGQVTQRAAADGGWLSQAYRTARTIEIEGALFASSWAAATRALGRLMAAIPLNVPATMQLIVGDESLQADVRQDGDPLVTRFNGTGYATFSLSFVAPDPRRYSIYATTTSVALPITTGGLSLPITLPLTIGATVNDGYVTVTNDGNEATPPVLTVIGPCAPCRITQVSTGKSLVVPQSVDAGRQLVLDASTRTALLDGTASRVVTGSWFDLPPGDSQVAFSAAYNAASLLLVSFRSAWR